MLICNKGNPAHKVEKRRPWKSQKAHGLAKGLTRQGEAGIQGEMRWKEKPSAERIKKKRNPRKGADDPRLALEQVLKEARKKEGKEMEEGLSKLNFLGRSKR